MHHSSRMIDTNQTCVHKNLERTVIRHLKNTDQTPIKDASKHAFDHITAWQQNDGRPVILDSCCGVGDSSRFFARQNPDKLILGIDKSHSRLTRERTEETPENMMLVRADLNDLFRLIAASGLPIMQQYILYPNPWPKSAHLKRRWHGSPAFPYIISIGKTLTLRSNWLLYLQEFGQALEFAGIKSTVKEITPNPPITPFEAKYSTSGHTLYELQALLD